MKKYNLVEYTWIPCFDLDDNFKKMNLKDILMNAHNIESLACDSSMQKLAIQQMLGAIIGRIYSEELEEEGQDFWFDLMDEGKFDVDKIVEYLEGQYDNLWVLNDEGIPFMQLVSLEDCDNLKPVSNFVSTMDVSANKDKLYTPAIESLYIDEAIRWLITFQACSTKSAFQGGTEKNDVPVSQASGRLANTLQMGYKGINLFETILLNLPCRKMDEGVYPRYKSTSWENMEVFKKGVKILEIEKGDLSAIWTFITKRCRLKFNDDFTQVEGIYVYTKNKNFHTYNQKLDEIDPYRVWEKKGSDFVKNDNGEYRAYKMSSSNTSLMTCMESATSIQPNDPKGKISYPWWKGSQQTADYMMYDYTIEYFLQALDSKGVMFDWSTHTSLYIDHRVYEDEQVKNQYEIIIHRYLKDVLYRCERMLKLVDQTSSDGMYSIVGNRVLSLITGRQMSHEVVEEVRKFMIKVVHEVKDYTVTKVIEGKFGTTSTLGKETKKNYVKQSITDLQEMLLNEVIDMERGAYGCLKSQKLQTES